ncbi:MAG TPA: L-threonylcarbamoyladenylate synthase [Actinomycetota bacterium]|nr:L-threonylcarbamoyladenylate synthase [Actinomycetota bacterium]
MRALEGPLGDAAAAARGGELIVFPTDTVYGIGTRPDDPAATARVFEAKRRPLDLELPVLVATVQAARAVAAFDERAERLAAALWPGPLTLVMPRGAHASTWDLGGDPATVGVRAPHHPMALALLAKTGPLAVTSANLSGRPPAETCDELHACFGDRVSVYLCQEDPMDGVASTVLDLAHGPATVIREGSLPREALIKLLPDELSLLDSSPSS